MRHRPRSGFSIIEVLIASAILAFCAVPILMMMSQSTRKAHFNEYHVSAQVQAHWIADCLQTLDYQDLLRRAQKASETAAGLKGLNDDQLKSVGVPLPALETQMAPYIAKETLHAPFLEHAVARSKWFGRKAFFREVEPGLGQLVVYLDWRLPNEPPTMRHFYVYRRLLARPEVSMMSNETIEAK